MYIDLVTNPRWKRFYVRDEKVNSQSMLQGDTLFNYLTYHSYMIFRLSNLHNLCNPCGWLSADNQWWMDEWIYYNNTYLISSSEDLGAWMCLMYRRVNSQIRYDCHFPKFDESCCFSIWLLLYPGVKLIYILHLISNGVQEIILNNI